MTQTRPLILAIAIILSTSTCLAQTPPTPQPAPATAPQPQTASPTPPKPLPAFYRNLIFLDPAHGGPDTGAHLPDNALEKDVTLAFAQRLRSALSAQGFTVISARDSDPVTGLPTDQRAGAANHARPLACIVLHATATGSGIHIASSSLTPDDSAAPRAISWQTAQSFTLPMSLRLANEIGLAASSARIPVTLLLASVPPLDNLTCPAVVLELAPNSAPVTDTAYQQRVAETIAAALASFRTHNAPPPSSTQPAPPPPAPKSAPTPVPAPATSPVQKPGASQ